MATWKAESVDRRVCTHATPTAFLRTRIRTRVNRVHLPVLVLHHHFFLIVVFFFSFYLF